MGVRGRAFLGRASVPRMRTASVTDVIKVYNAPNLSVKTIRLSFCSRAPRRHQFIGHARSGPVGPDERFGRVRLIMAMNQWTPLSPALKPRILSEPCIDVRIKYFYSFMTFGPVSYTHLTLPTKRIV